MAYTNTGTGRRDVIARRDQPFVWTIAFKNQDLTGAALAMQIRDYRDAPGTPPVSLVNSVAPAQGLSVTLGTYAGVPASIVEVRISKRTMRDLRAFPGSGAKVGPDGPAVRMAYDLHVTPPGGLEKRWLQGDFIIEPGVTKDLVAANVVTAGNTLTGFRTAIAALLSAYPSGKITVPIMGDSYAEQTKIWDALRQLYAADGFTITGDGYINVRGVTEPTGVSFSRSGWTLYDASDSGSPAYRTGIDGHYIATSGTGASFKVTGTICNELWIFYDRGQTGKFRYRAYLTGTTPGAWTTVTPTGAAGLTAEKILNLPTGSYTLEVDTSVNSPAGPVVIQGIYSTLNGPGIEFLKCGNSSLQATDFAKFEDYAGDMAFLLGAKLVLIFDGANDYQRSDSPPATYAARIGSLTTRLRSLSPGLSVVAVVPPDLAPAAVNPLSAYATAMDAQAVTSGIDVFFWNRFFDTWAVENAAGNFTDLEHPDAKGALEGMTALKTLLLDAR